MSEIPFVQAQSMGECFTFPAEPPTNPIVDSYKESAFYPEIHAYVTVNAKVRQGGDFWIEFNTMAGERLSGMEMYINKCTNVEEGLQFLRKVNRVTDSLISFIEKNHLKQAPQD